MDKIAEIAEVAESLTERERAFILAVKLNGALFQPHLLVADSLEAKRVLSPQYDAVMKEFGYAFTGLGLAVRKHLNGE